jgi:thiamine-monophosphate kinase
MTVADLTERELIARIQEQLPPAPDWVLVGVGDDAAVVLPERNRVEALTVDALVEGIHFDRAFVPPDAIGHRALAVNLSDLAAMGATPRLALLSIVLPSTFPLHDFDRMVGGFASLASRHRLQVVGGNLTRSPGPLVLDVTAIGSIKPRQALTRGGASPGDVLFVSGTLGAAAAGLQMLKAALRDTATVTGTSRGEETSAYASADSTPIAVVTCVDRYLRPEPRVRHGVLLAKNRAATACMDLSDGLADAIHQIAHASGVGVIVDADALPIAPETRRWLGAHAPDPVTAAMTGGDDYELLVTVHPRKLRRFAAAIPAGEVPFTRIGTCTKERAVVVRRAGAAPAESPLPQAGYSHFR